MLDEFESVSLVKQELAQDAYEFQDEETKRAIDRVTATLQQHATGYVNVKVGGTLHALKIENEYLGYNLFWLAVEIVKGLAFVGLRVANWQWPELLCASCGSEIVPEKHVQKRRSK